MYNLKQLATIYIFFETERLIAVVILQGQRAWWSVTLEKATFVYKVWVINRPECCFKEMPKLSVVLRNSEKSEKAVCKVYDWKVQQRRLMICEPSIKATNLTIIADEADGLTLCEVMISATGEKLSCLLHLIFQDCSKRSRCNCS